MNASEKKAPGLSERKVRREARRIVNQLDRFMDNVYTVVGCLALMAGIVAFPYCWKVLDQAWWEATLWAFGVLVLGFVAAGIAGVWIEHRAWQKAVRRFNLRFPENSPHRPVAEAMLADVEPGSDAVKTFLEHVLTQPLPSTATPAYARPTTPTPSPSQRRSPRSPAPSYPAPEVQNATIPLELPSKSR